MTKYRCTEEEFLREVTQHAINIINDDGIHRHIVFRHPGSSSFWFELITWPGTLCINGDCGTYVFSRIQDMFNFFSSKNSDDNLQINPHYWGEKLQAVDRCSGFMKFDEDSFRERVKDYFDSFVESNPELNDHKDELWGAIVDDVLYHSSNEHEAYQAVNDFNHEIGDRVFEFTDFFDGGGTETYAARYLWCLYAIVWGIKKYDMSKSSTT